MLFNSLAFVAGFLPPVLLAYTLLCRLGRAAAAKLLLVVASLIFYGWWNPRHVPLILLSITVNWLLSRRIEQRPVQARPVLALGLAFNLGLLGYFKYFTFFAGNLGPLLGLGRPEGGIVLPLAISFFTFQQIAYLVEVYRDRRAADNALDYSLFVLFFPHLIAGPITHHKEMLPQFARAGGRRVEPALMAGGTAIFLLGLAKKVLIADGLAQLANPVFAAADGGQALSAAAAWMGALAYSFQLYFDFSGYSDMAIGLGLLFGIRLPANFASPYKADSIIEFWRRWHISLSRFLRNYLYIPLGGNRHGPARRYLNLLLTMGLGGLWHGAGWTFIAWGLLHGAYLAVNHLWCDWPRLAGARRALAGPAGRLAGRSLTFLAVVAAWVLFRAGSFQGALSVLAAMSGAGAGAAVPEAAPALLSASAILAVAAAGGLAFLAPNSLEITGYGAGTAWAAAPLKPVRLALPHGLAAAMLGVVAALALAELPNPGVFLYFNF